MTVETLSLEVPSRGLSQVHDITNQVGELVQGTGLDSGQVLVFVAGSTASVTTIEYESGAVSDLQAALERMAPQEARYAHNERWHDGNGFSHVRAALLGPGCTVPFVEGRLLLGTWQQLVLVDHDNRPRKRKVIVQVMGE